MGNYPVSEAAIRPFGKLQARFPVECCLKYTYSRL